MRDWEALEAALADQPDVDGDRIQGWTRFEDSGDGLRRTRLALNVVGGEPGGRDGKSDRLEVFTQTLRRADQAREAPGRAPRNRPGGRSRPPPSHLPT